MSHATPASTRPTTVAALRPTPRREQDPAVRIGLLVNPHARAMRAAGDDGPSRLRQALGQSATIGVTRSRDEVGPTLAKMMRDEGVNVLAVAGGDGTLHLAINELAVLGRATRARGEAWHPPVLLPLRGGTLNIVAGETARRPAHEVLARFARDHQGARRSRVATRRVPLLRVESPDVGERLGFIFGSEMVRNALELYDRFGGGYEGLSKFLFEAARGYAFRTALWRQEGWRATPPRHELELLTDTRTRRVAAYSAAVASTVDLTIAGGALSAIRRRSHHGGFFTRVITEVDTGRLLRMVPALVRAAPLDAVVDEAEATGLDLRGAFTLDGECFGRPSTLTPDDAAPLRLRLADEPVELALA